MPTTTIESVKKPLSTLISAFKTQKTPVFGGISPQDAKLIYDQMRSETFAKKNLWRVTVTSSLASVNVPAERFNLFATEVDYSVFTIQADKVKIGGMTVDLVDSAEPIELRITTLDDQSGTLKRWFRAHFEAVTANDGTVNEPAKYAIGIKVSHGFINPDEEPEDGRFEINGYFRPQSLDLSLSRREDALEEISMTFSQLDTFMRP